MKTAKFVIMLQVLFLVGIFVFSASAVYQPGQGGPLAINNVAPNYGHEKGSKGHDELQVNLESVADIEKAAEDLKAGTVKDYANAEMLNIDGVDGAYSFEFFYGLDKTLFSVVMARSDADRIGRLFKRDDELSDHLGVFVSQPYSKESIESAIAAGKGSSAGTVSEKLSILRDQLKLYETDGYPETLQAALDGLSSLGTVAHPALNDLAMLLEKERSESVKDDIWKKIGRAHV